MWYIVRGYRSHPSAYRRLVLMAARRARIESAYFIPATSVGENQPIFNTFRGRTFHPHKLLDASSGGTTLTRACTLGG